jgi:ABC-type lipoprotein release transport system permease subunit
LLSFVSARLIKSFLYQVQPLDVLTYVAVAVTLSVIGLIAALIPARRAAYIEPMQALRTE